MRRIFDGYDTLLISKSILDELLATLARKFSCGRAATKLKHESK
jgi:hypothetical protein